MGSGNSIEIPGGGHEGYHILKVLDNSPGSRAGVEPFFDFIVAVNGIRLVGLLTLLFDFRPSPFNLLLTSF